MTSSEIMEAVLNNLNQNANEFAENLNLKRSQNIYDVLKGKTGISKGLASKIVSVYPRFNKSWLLTGDGEMILTKITPAVTTNEDVWEAATIKMLFHEVAKLKAKIFMQSYDDIVTEMKQNTIPIIKDILKDKGADSST